MGNFKEEIVPVHTKLVDPKTGEEKQVTIAVDDGIRPQTTLAELAKLKPAFKKGGSTTAGNSSQVSDGAGAVLLMKRRVALERAFLCSVFSGVLLQLVWILRLWVLDLLWPYPRQLKQLALNLMT
jgi:acetyl-CoA acetyltransferase